MPGGRPSPYTLTATVPGLPAARLTVAPQSACEKDAPISFGQTVSGRIVPGIDCGGGAQVLDNYAISLSAPTILTTEVSSSTMSPASFANYANGPQIMGRA